MTFIAGFRQERFSSVVEMFLLGYYSNLHLSRDRLTAGEFTGGGFAPYIRCLFVFWLTFSPFDIFLKNELGRVYVLLFVPGISIGFKSSKFPYCFDNHG